MHTPTRRFSSKHSLFVSPEHFLTISDSSGDIVIFSDDILFYFCHRNTQDQAKTSLKKGKHILVFKQTKKNQTPEKTIISLLYFLNSTYISLLPWQIKVF